MTEEIQLDGGNICDDYKTENILDDNEETIEETTQPNKITLNLPEIKSPEFWERLNKIKEWKRKFPEECKDIDIKNENKLTFDEVLHKLEECKDAVASRPDAQMHKLGFKVGLSIVETQLAPAMKLDLKGLANTAMDDEGIMKTLDEIALLQDWSSKVMTAEQRLLFSLGHLAYKINASNKAAKKELKMPENEGNYDDL